MMICVLKLVLVLLIIIIIIMVILIICFTHLNWKKQKEIDVILHIERNISSNFYVFKQWF